ncbi:MAG: tRNA (adenosine(37)-N6)-threonylcarbamoyltransferase complex dimerization subunit type 1 TsaB [SAR202 cluster bacterium]|nr:tRNA (adenosine(37)-N6)-threonylcarbamoyltransferase complex dimerization subunit type 1 TsaB [SAR202 cluster bacterium]|tara:strand:+ start:11197 stop:11874 length:678 start_codon:yes stop_codon:yes gene_type:complete
MELSIDTSTSFSTISLSSEGIVIKELSWDAKRNHSMELCPAIWSILDQANIKPTNLKSVFIAKGPGGFSSLRVGMSFAKAISMTLQIPLVSISTLDIEIKPYLPSKLPVFAMIKASTKSVYSISNLDRNESIRVINLDEIDKVTTSKTIFCGEAMTEVGSILNSKLGDLAIVKADPMPTRKASVLASLGYIKLMEFGGEDIDALEPVYISGAQYDSAIGQIISKR